jgi:hypothetical protein
MLSLDLTKKKFKTDARSTESPDIVSKMKGVQQLLQLLHQTANGHLPNLQQAELRLGPDLISQAIVDILNYLEWLTEIVGGHCQKRGLELANMRLPDPIACIATRTECSRALDEFSLTVLVTHTESSFQNTGYSCFANEVTKPLLSDLPSDFRPQTCKHDLCLNVGSSYFVEKPNPTLGLVDPVLKHARRCNVSKLAR